MKKKLLIGSFALGAGLLALASCGSSVSAKPLDVKSYESNAKIETEEELDAMLDLISTYIDEGVLSLLDSKNGIPTTGYTYEYEYNVTADLKYNDSTEKMSENEVKKYEYDFNNHIFYTKDETYMEAETLEESGSEYRVKEYQYQKEDYCTRVFNIVEDYNYESSFYDSDIEAYSSIYREFRLNISFKKNNDTRIAEYYYNVTDDEIMITQVVNRLESETTLTESSTESTKTITQYIITKTSFTSIYYSEDKIEASNGDNKASGDSKISYSTVIKFEDTKIKALSAE